MIIIQTLEAQQKTYNLYIKGFVTVFGGVHLQSTIPPPSIFFTMPTPSFTTTSKDIATGMSYFNAV